MACCKLTKFNLFHVCFAAVVVSVTCRVYFAAENAIPEFSPTVVNKWVTIDYVRPKNLSYHRFMMKYTYDYRNTVLMGLKVYKGEVYVTIPRLSPGVSATLNRVVEKDGLQLLEPFPNWDWQEIGNCDFLQSVNNIEIDHKRGWMWIVDTGRIQTLWGGLRNLCTPKVIVYDINRREVVSRYEFPPDVASITDAYLYDIAIDPEKLYAFIPNTVPGRLIFYSLNDNFSISVDHKLFKYEHGNNSITINGRTGKFAAVSSHISGIAMSPRRDYIVFSHLGGYGLYRVRMEFFKEVLQNPEYVRNIDGYIDRVGYKVAHSRGLVFGQDNLYYGALGKESVYRWPIADALSYPNVTEETISKIPQVMVASDDRMYWVDTLTLDEEGTLWVSSSNLLRYFLDVMDYHGIYNYFIWKIGVGETSYLTKKTSPLPTTTTPEPTTTVSSTLAQHRRPTSLLTVFDKSRNSADSASRHSAIVGLKVAILTAVLCA